MRQLRILGAAVMLAGCTGGPGGFLRMGEAPRKEPGRVPSLVADEAGLRTAGLAVAWKARVATGEAVSLHLGRRTCYVETGDLKVHAFDRGNGFCKWILPIPGALQAAPGEAQIDGTPDAVGMAYFVAANRLTAVDIDDPTGRGAETGRIAWTASLPCRATTPPVATDHYLAVGGADGSVHVFQLRETDVRESSGFRRTHDRAWHCNTEGEVLGAPILPPDVPGQIIVGSGAGIVSSRNLGDGSLRWRYPYEGSVGPVQRGMCYDVCAVPSPAPLPGGLKAPDRVERVLVVAAMDNTLQMLDPDGGVLLSRSLLTAGVSQAPLVHTRLLRGPDPDWMLVRDVYCVARDGRLFAYRVEDAHRARRDAEGKPAMGENGTDVLWMIEANDGDDVFGGEGEPPPPLTEEEIDAGKAPPRAKVYPIQWAPRERWVAGGVERVVALGRAGLYVVGKDGRLRLLDEGGNEVWSRPLDGVVALPRVEEMPQGDAPARIYLMDGLGQVWCLQEQ